MTQNHVISRWLQLRQKILISYCCLLKVYPFKDENFYSTEEILQQLCTMLHEYLTTSDLHIFESATINRKILQEITKTSFQATSFYNQYIDISSEKLRSSQDNLIADLNELGQVFSTRMEIEDQLIEQYGIA